MNNIISNAQGAIGYLDCCQDLKKAPDEVITPDAYNFNENQNFFGGLATENKKQFMLKLKRMLY